jgi:c-di-GMP phosphodiesterase
MTTYLMPDNENNEDEPVSNLAEPLFEASLPLNVHIVRKPILNTDMEVYAYNLLYDKVEPPSTSLSNETCQVILDVFLDIGLNVISEEYPSVISITEDFVHGRLPLPFPPRDVILELPGTLHQAGMSLVPLEALCAKGYKLSFVAPEPTVKFEEILKHIYMLKVDLCVWSKEQLELYIPKLLLVDVKLVATNVNTREEQAFCQALGFELYQGQFISEPVVVSGSTLKPSRIALLTILELLEDPDCDISDLESLISQDITLSYKILRIINSAFYGFRRKIDSVKQAVVSLGLKVIRDWFIVISLTDIDDKPHSLMFQTLQRARMMQLLADVVGLNKDTGFTVGLFSSIDAMMDQPMNLILQSLPLSHEITDALLEREGLLGELLDIVIRYEQGDWKNINSVGFELSELSIYYFDSLLWARGLIEQIKSD